jgi:uncharacterized lipoprotein YajG
MLITKKEGGRKQIMTKTATLRLSLVLLALFFAVTACVPAVRLAHTPLDQAEVKKGSVIIGSINNLRPEKKGRRFGNPFTLNAQKNKTIDMALREAVTDALINVGYNIVTPAVKKDAPRLEVDVLKFWCDGYMGYNIDTAIVVKLINGASGKVLAQREINVSRGFALVAGYSPMHQAFNEVMNDITRELVGFMTSHTFQRAVSRS